MKRKLIRRGDLPDCPPAGVALRCGMCGVSYSATRGDYFLESIHTVLKCDACERPLELVERVTVYRAWAPT